MGRGMEWTTTCCECCWLLLVSASICHIISYALWYLISPHQKVTSRKGKNKAEGQSNTHTHTHNGVKDKKTSQTLLSKERKRERERKDSAAPYTQIDLSFKAECKRSYLLYSLGSFRYFWQIEGCVSERRERT